MVDEQLSSALRDLPGKVLNVPVEERQLIFRNVSSVLRNPAELLLPSSWLSVLFVEDCL
ncbi:uncharacterized protein l(3)80Fj isoform X4 [Drosophila suzukii]|uniref:Uncharacterized protein l(3)80Fj isoform X4 n=1 Tax=Drosophila suzukii TaxID=28584 RepID=A0ABM4TR52_DROSZ|nr:uncharacterized protein LOC108011730 isoform X5 [Drosophila suzukii]